MVNVKSHTRKTKKGQVGVRAHQRVAKPTTPKPKKYKLKYLIHTKLWHDDVNGNTYHSVTILDADTKEELAYSGLTYGYGEQYRHTAYDLLVKLGLRKDKDRHDHERNRAEMYFTSEWTKKRDL